MDILCRRIRISSGVALTANDTGISRHRIDPLSPRKSAPIYRPYLTISLPSSIRCLPFPPPQEVGISNLHITCSNALHIHELKLKEPIREICTVWVAGKGRATFDGLALTKLRRRSSSFNHQML